jgi:hypothetical protein
VVGGNLYRNRIHGRPVTVSESLYGAK